MAALARKQPSTEYRLEDKPKTPARQFDKNPDRGELSAAALVAIENDLDHADLPKVIRWQPVCAVSSNMAVRRVFDELYIHIAHLRQMLHSDVDCF